MQILLLFVLAIATFGTCKKSHAKHDGHLVHKKGHKKSATHLKMKKSHRKLKPKVEPKEQGADYNDIGRVANWEEKEKEWMDKWDTEWERIYSQAKIENLKPKPESGREPEGWDSLMDALRDRDKAKDEEQKIRNITREYIRFFVNPDHKRPGLKWVQTTEDTEDVFLVHTVAKYLQDSIEQVKRRGKKEKRPCDATHTCSWTTHSQPIPTHSTTEASTTTAATTFNPAQLWEPLIKDPQERKFVNSFINRELGQRTWTPKKKALNSDYSEDWDSRLECKPKNR